MTRYEHHYSNCSKKIEDSSGHNFLQRRLHDSYIGTKYNEEKG